MQHAYGYVRDNIAVNYFKFNYESFKRKKIHCTNKEVNN